MATRTDALTTLMNIELVLGADTTKETLREAAIDSATGAILSWTGRQIIHNPGLATQTIEYHDPEPDWEFFYTREFPINSINSLYNDPDRIYGSTSLLALNTDYIYYGDEGRIQLVNSSGLSIVTARETMTFLSGPKAIKLTYTAGYTDIPSIPDDLVQAANEWTIFILNTQKDAGFSENSVSLCRRIFSMAAKAGPPPHVRTLLAPYRAPHILLA